LLEVRTKLGLSQNEMISRLGLGEDITQARVSAYERGVREPPLTVLLKYARAAGLYVEILIDDDLDLPERMPGPVRHEVVMKPFASKRKAKK
jgi:transcriptional regulator with XRE-family HTH domain